MARKKTTLHSRLKSIQFALTGIWQMARAEPNAKIHLVATVLVIAYGCSRQLSHSQWIAIAIAIGLVWITEAINTAIEMLCDLYSKEYNPAIKRIKDIAAGAVLIAAITSIIIALFIFV